MTSGASGAPRHAEVAGGGIVGFAAAALLTAAGWSVRVHERKPEIREVGAAIGIKPGGATVLRKLGIHDEICKTVALTVEERRDKHGRVLQSRRLEGGARFYNPLRQDLIDGLRDAAVAGGADVRTSSNVVSADPAGSVTLEDGTVLRADLVIAADGFHSRLRSSLGLERRARLVPAGTARVLIPRDNEEMMRLEYWSGALRIGVAPTTDTVTYVYLSAPEADARAKQVPIDADYWAERFPGLPESFFRRIQDAGGVRHQYPLVYCHRWYRGRVALVGDAAHALPATLGLGASMGMVNAYHLVTGLGDDIEASLEQWDGHRRRPSVRTQRCAMAYNSATTRWPETLEPVRNAILRMLDRPAINRRVLGLKAIEIRA